jgi:hypothetical protein
LPGTNHYSTGPRGSAIDFFAVSDAEDQDQQAVVFDLTDEAERADAISPKLTQAGSLQRLAKRARVGQLGDPFPMKFRNAFGVLRMELAKFAAGLGGKLNLSGHDALQHLRGE